MNLKMDKTKSNKNRYFCAQCQWNNYRTFNVECEFNVGLASVVLDVARVRAGVLGLVVLQKIIIVAEIVERKNKLSSPSIQG